MSAADYYGTGPSPPYRSQKPSHESRHRSSSRHHQHAPQSQGLMVPYQQHSSGRPGSSHSDAGYLQQPTYAPDPYTRPQSAEPYAEDHSRGRQHEYQEDGEKGLGATLVGGGAGGLLGHKLGKGKIGTILGGVVGAVAANAVENRLQGKHGSHAGHSPYGHGGHGRQSGGLLGSVSSFLGGKRDESSSGHGGHGSHHSHHSHHSHSSSPSGHGHHGHYSHHGHHGQYGHNEW